MTLSGAVHFTIVRTGRQVTDCRTTSPDINHFLDVVEPRSGLQHLVELHVRS